MAFDVNEIAQIAGSKVARRDAAPTQARAVATVACDQSSVALPVGQTHHKPRQAVGISGQTSTDAVGPTELACVTLNENAFKGSDVLTIIDKRGKGMETTGIESATSWLQTRRIRTRNHLKSFSNSRCDLRSSTTAIRRPRRSFCRSRTTSYASLRLVTSRMSHPATR